MKLFLCAVLLTTGVLAQQPQQPQITYPTAYVKEKGGLKPGIGVVDGFNRVFTLTFYPSSTVELFVFLDGLYMSEGDDYTVSGRSITFIKAPSSGSSVRVVYAK